MRRRRIARQGNHAAELLAFHNGYVIGVRDGARALMLQHPVGDHDDAIGRRRESDDDGTTHRRSSTTRATRRRLRDRERTSK